MKDNKPTDADQLQDTQARTGEIVSKERDEIVKMPQGGRVQHPYNHPYDRHSLPINQQDQTDRAVIKHFLYKGYQVYLKKKLSGREYTWEFRDIYNSRYAGTFIDRLNQGDDFSLAHIANEACENIDYITS